MRMTIKDIARLSGYGIGTVSRVLNNHPDVSEKARKKILSVIEENNFQRTIPSGHRADMGEYDELIGSDEETNEKTELI